MRFLTRVFNPADIDPENRGTAMLLAGLGLLVILAIALIGYGYYNDRIKPKHETVFTVGGRSYSYADLEHRVDSEIKSGAFDTSDLQNSISSLVLKMQTEELTRLTAKGKGITATDEEIDKAMLDDLGLGDTTPRSTLADGVQRQLNFLGLSLNQYREVMKTQVLEQKLKDGIATTVPAEGEQVDLLIIQTATKDAAQQALDRIKAGEEFQDVAQQVSVHETKAVGGEFGWTPRGLLPKDIEDQVFSLSGLSEVYEDDLGFFLFETRDKQTRAIDDSLKERIVQSELNSMLLATRDSVGVTNKLTVGQVRDLASHIQASSVASG
jgi:hypothetical protein